MWTPGTEPDVVGWPVGQARQPDGGHQVVVELQQIGVVDGPGLVVVRHVERATGPARVQAPAGTQEVVELGARARRPGTDDHVAGGAYAGPAQTGVVGVLVALHAIAHPRPAVGDAETGAGAGDHRGAVGVETEEDDPAAAGVVDGVEPHVGLEEGPQPRDGVVAAEPGTDHAERDEADVGAALEGVGPYARRHPVGHQPGVDRPVQERQVAPALAHQHPARQVRCLGGHGLDHSPSLDRRSRPTRRDGCARPGCPT